MGIKIIIADSSFSSRKGLIGFVEGNQDFEYIASVTNIKMLIETLQNQSADVLIIHYCCDDCFSTDAIKEIKLRSPDINILVISHKKEPEEITKIIDIGIRNYILDDCSEEEIKQAIEACAEGAIFFSNKIIDVLLERDFKVSPVIMLSQRENEVVQLIAEGLTGKEVAERLSLSIYTVYAHRKNIIKKLHIKSTAELVLYAIRFGLISPGK